MATVDTSVNELVINKLTQAQYDALTEKSPTEVYFVTDAQDDSSPIQVEVMPEASADYAGKIIQYIGETNAEYTRGFFYEFGEKFIMPTVREFDVSVSTPTGDASVEVEDQEKFFEFVIQTVVDNGYSGLVTAPTHVNIMLDPAFVDGDKYPVTIVAGEGEIEMQALFTLEDLQQNTGISGLNDSGEYMIVDIMFNLTTPGSLTEGWKRVDVQPIFAVPEQTDNAGKFLTTDGTTVSWGNALVNNTDRDTSMGIGSKATAYSAVAIGVDIRQVTNSSVTIGYKAGTNTISAVAIGSNAYAGGYGLAFGSQMSASAEHSIQIGSSSTKIGNTDPNTFKVYNGVSNYEIMSADGTIPTDRYTTTPTSAGTYVPKLTIAEDGTATREWGTESGGAGGDYLPLSGGTMSGPIKFSEDFTGGSISISADYYGVMGGTVCIVSGGTLIADNIHPADNKLTDLGMPSDYSPFDGDYGYGGLYYRRICTTAINNGASTDDIKVPTTGGTMIVATPPTDNGTYVLKATVVDGVVTTEWVLEA